MYIKKLSTLKGASRFGSCVECGKCESDTHSIYSLNFSGSVICLCHNCFRKARAAMNSVVLDGYIGVERE